jgi:dipeptidyl aminopeptidase/acylaminoacyl peptidase
LIVHGADDERVPHSQAVAFHRALRNQEAPVELVTYPREPHAVGERLHQLDLMRRVVAWYDRWLT